MRHASLRALRSIAAIARRGRIVEAAPELGLTPSAVTIQLRQMEAAAGLPLFDRTPDGMRATAAGQAVIEAANAVEAQLRALQDTLDAIKGVRQGTLRLGVVSTAKYFAPGMMAAFRALYPEIDMRLLVGNRAETIAHLRDHSVDIAIMGRPPGSLPVRATLIGDHPLVIVAGPSHPLAQVRGIPKEIVAAEAFVVREQGSGTRISMEIFMRDVPGWLEREFSEMDSNETIKQAVMAGLGIAFISGHTVVSEVEGCRLAVLDVEGMPVRRQWFGVMRRERRPTPVVSAFIGFLTTQGTAQLGLLNQLYP